MQYYKIILCTLSFLLSSRVTALSTIDQSHHSFTDSFFDFYPVDSSDKEVIAERINTLKKVLENDDAFKKSLASFDDACAYLNKLRNTQPSLFCSQEDLEIFSYEKGLFFGALGFAAWLIYLKLYRRETTKDIFKNPWLYIVTTAWATVVAFGPESPKLSIGNAAFSLIFGIFAALAPSCTLGYFGGLLSGNVENDEVDGTKITVNRKVFRQIMETLMAYLFPFCTAGSIIYNFIIRYKNDSKHTILTEKIIRYLAKELAHHKEITTST